MKEYTKLRITANALVPRGAVQEKAIFKDANIRVQLTDVIKAEDKQIMYSIMFHLNKADSQDCIVTKAEVLEEAAREFMKTGAKNLKILHNGEFTDGAEYQELWIVKAGDPIFTKPEHVGALANGIYFPDKALFQKMKTEGWETSIEGTAEEIEIEKSDSWIERIVKKTIELLTVKKEVEMKPDEIKALIIATVQPMLDELKKPEEKPDPTEPEKTAEPVKPEDEEMKKTIEDLKKSVAGLETEIKKHGSSQTREHEETKNQNVVKGILGTYKRKE